MSESNDTEIYRITKTQKCDTCGETTKHLYEEGEFRCMEDHERPEGGLAAFTEETDG